MRDAHQVFYKKIQLPFKLKHAVLALGAQGKNTLCFAKGRFAYLSQVHPDLNLLRDFLDFQKAVKYFLKKRPEIIACDLHPEYQSTKFAQQLSTIPACRSGRRYPLSTIQHHHAHIASCMAENGLKNQKVIGVAFDGTGLGSDNTLWGAEFLICDYSNFRRAAHLKEVPLLGGQRAILEPWRVAAAWLSLVYKDRFLNSGVKFAKGINKKKWLLLKRMNSSGFNSPLASSMGRLFDAAASLILAEHKVNSARELPMRLEKIAMRYACPPDRLAPCVMRYGFKISRSKDNYIIDPAPMFKEIIADLKANQPQEQIAYRFHLTVGRMVRKTCLILRKNSKINKIVLSGGVFQNTLLLQISLDLLYKEGFKVFTHKKLSCNDSCVSLGQAAIAGFRS